MAVFTSGIVLLLSIWGGKKSGLGMDPCKEMKDVHKCMIVLKGCEERWHSAGRLWYNSSNNAYVVLLFILWFRDILYELASVGDLPLPQGSPYSSNKRERNSDSPISMGEDACRLPKKGLMDRERTVAGSKRVNKIKEQGHSNRQSQCKQPSAPIFQQQQELLTDVIFPQQDSTLIIDSTPSPLQSQSQSRSQSQPQMDMSTLPVYSDELGRVPLVNHTTSSSPLSSSSLRPPPPPSMLSSSLSPSSAGYHQHMSNFYQPGNPGGLWYSFEQGQTQMLGLEGLGMVGSESEQLSGGMGNGNGGVVGSGMGLGSGFDGMGNQQQQSQVDEADFIFNQLAMGYPAVPSLSLYMAGLQSGLITPGSLQQQQQQILSGMGMGMTGSQHHGGGTHGVGGSTQNCSGLAPSSVVDREHRHQQHEYMTNIGSESMSMWPSAPSTGFE